MRQKLPLIRRRIIQQSLKRSSKTPSVANVPYIRSYHFQSVESNGSKFAHREIESSFGSLAIVAKGGTRYQPAPGISQGLENFAFRSTAQKSTLRIVREVEMLGGQLATITDRENLVIIATFFKENFLYFAELLAEIASSTKYNQYAIDEEIKNLMRIAQEQYSKDAKSIAIDLAHSAAFHNALGQPNFSSTSEHPHWSDLNYKSIESFASTVFSKQNMAVVGDGINKHLFEQYVPQFFSSIVGSSDHTGSQTKSKYFGGQQRVQNNTSNSIVLGFLGSSSSLGSSFKPEVEVLAALLGGHSSIKWSRGSTLLSQANTSVSGVQLEARSHSYSDAGLMTITMSGSASGVREAAKNSIKVLQAVANGEFSKDDTTRAIARAKFERLDGDKNLSTISIIQAGSALVHNEEIPSFDKIIRKLEAVTPQHLSKFASEILNTKASVGVVGNLHVLPYAEELKLSV